MSPKNGSPYVHTIWGPFMLYVDNMDGWYGTHVNGLMQALNSGISEECVRSDPWSNFVCSWGTDVGVANGSW